MRRIKSFSSASASRCPPSPDLGLASVPPRDLPPQSGDERSRVGVCTDCRHARRIVSAKGSSFWLCERAATEPSRFAKYPRLPVLVCTGLERALPDS